MILDNYTLLFEDNFDTLNISTDAEQSGWNTEYHYGDRYLHNEMQVYVDPDYAGLGLNPFSVNDGVLTITAQKAPEGMPTPDGFSWGSEDTYTSGLMTTEQSFSVQYGYFEMSAQMPEGSGLWPAFWLLQSNGEWPAEIDVVEVLGQNPDQLWATSHIVDDNGQHAYESTQSTLFDSSDGFHTYGLDWQHDTITWYFDGVKVFEAENTVEDQTMYMLLNLAVGGWAGTPVESAFPAEMNVDYVRVYQKGVEHDIVGVPSGWQEIPMSAFSELDSFSGTNVSSYTLWEYSGALPEGIQKGYMSGSWPHELTGNDLDNYIVGADGKFNRLDGAGGDDILKGNAGTDYFVLRQGDGNDTILDFSNEDGNTDKLYLDGFHFTHFQDVLPYMTQKADGVMLRLDQDQAVFLQNTLIEDITPEQFIFVNSVAAPADAPIIKPYEPVADELADTPPTISFKNENILDYGIDQNADNLFVIEEAGDTLSVSGNSWVGMDFDYSITQDTVLSFDFKTYGEAEIQGIGFDVDNGISANQTFVLAGTQNWGLSDHKTYDVSSGEWAHYKIQVSDFFDGTFSKLFFVNDKDSGSKDATSYFRNVSVYEHTPVETQNVEPIIDTLSFAADDILTYEHGQDMTPDAFEVSGTQLYIEGNSWKRLAHDYEVGEFTMLSFDFQSSQAGEIHGIGIDDDNTWETDRVIKLYGTQNWQNNAHSYDGQGDVQSYDISLSNYYGVGTAFSHLVFANDDDANALGNSTYDNIRLYEHGTLMDDIITGHEHDQTILGMDGDDVLYGAGGQDLLYGGSGADTFMFDTLSIASEHDIIGDFSVSQGDVLDIANLLEGYDPLQDVIQDFVQVTDNGVDTSLAVDSDGGGDAYVQIAVLQGVSAAEQDIFDSLVTTL